MALDPSKLSIEQSGLLDKALRAAFPNTGELKALLRFGLGENLANISDQTTLGSVVLDIIQWAEAHSKVVELVRAAVDRNSDHHQVKALAAWLPENEGVGIPVASVGTLISDALRMRRQVHFDTLVRKGFYKQNQLAKQVIETHHIAAFMVEGKDPHCGQQILRRQLEKLVPGVGSTEPIRIDMSFDGIWADTARIWREISRNVGIDPAIYPNPTPELVLGKVLQSWESQPVIFIFNRVDKMLDRRPPPTELSEWIKEFWDKLVEKAQAQIKTWQDAGRTEVYKLLLIMVDEEGKSTKTDAGLELVGSATEQGYPIVPLWLALPETFSLETFESWVEHLLIGEDAAAGLIIHADLTAAGIWKQSQGRPQAAFQAVCDLCQWEGVLDKWVS